MTKAVMSNTQRTPLRKWHVACDVLQVGGKCFAMNKSPFSARHILRLGVGGGSCAGLPSWASTSCCEQVR